MKEKNFVRVIIVALILMFAFSYIILDIRFRSGYEDDIVAYTEFKEVYSYFDNLQKNGLDNTPVIDVFSLPKHVAYSISSEDDNLSISFYPISSYSVPSSTFTISKSTAELTPIPERYESVELYASYLKGKTHFDNIIISIVFSFILLLTLAVIVFLLMIIFLKITNTHSK